jgi:hypothetical protein
MMDAFQDQGGRETTSTSGRCMTAVTTFSLVLTRKRQHAGATLEGSKDTPATTHQRFVDNLLQRTSATLTPTITMTTDCFLARKQSGLSDGVESPISPASSQARSNPLTTKVTSVLSVSYADSDIRDALHLLDKRGLQNSSETRRQLRLDVQKEVIESNGDIIREFGHVAEVSPLSKLACLTTDCLA